MMNAMELNNKEMDMVNGGYDKLYDSGVIDLSDVEECEVLGPSNIERQRYKSLGELRLEQKLADEAYKASHKAN